LGHIAPYENLQPYTRGYHLVASRNSYNTAYVKLTGSLAVTFITVHIVNWCVKTLKATFAAKGNLGGCCGFVVF